VGDASPLRLQCVSRGHVPLTFSAFLHKIVENSSNRAQKRGGASASACSECGLASNHGEGVLQAHDKSDGPGKLLVNVEEWRGLLRLRDEGDARPEIETRSVCHGGAVRHGGAEETASSAVCRKRALSHFAPQGHPGAQVTIATERSCTHPLCCAPL
jgi:hypothetical protein